MRKLYLLSLLLPLWTLLPSFGGAGGGGLLSAANCVSVHSVSANYATKAVTFTLTWSGCNGADHLNKAWVFVDYQTITGTSRGAWAPATIVGTPSVSNGTYAAGNSRGFYVTGVNGQTATVTVTLGGVPAQFNWCAYATDYQPNAVMSNGTYTLKGTTPFTINGGTSVSARTYTGACITAITDPTGCPGTVTNPVFSTGTIASTGQTLCTGGTPVNITSTAPATGGDNRITYQWYKNGAVINGATATTYTPPIGDATAVAAHTYTRRAKDATCNTTLTASAGSWVLTVHRTCGNGSAITTCNTVNIAFTSGFTSSQTWVVGSQTWSAPVTATYCRKLNFNGGSSGAYGTDCRANNGTSSTAVNATYGDLLSWCMVAKFKSTICPAGWRVPTRAEFIALDRALGGTGANGQDNATLRNKYLSSWGGQYGGNAANSKLYNQGSSAYYWAQAESNANQGDLLSFYSDRNVLYPQNAGNKYDGFSLRCINK